MLAESWPGGDAEPGTPEQPIANGSKAVAVTSTAGSALGIAFRGTAFNLPRGTFAIA
jgi:hypothetical protein